MQTTLIGIAICALLLSLSRTRHATLLVSLIASVAFGSTSIAELGGLGTPLIYVVFELAFIASVFFRRRFLDELVAAFHAHRATWAVLALLIYTAGSAILLPRLFAGATGAFVPVLGLVSEVPLAPVSGNIAQSSYFVAGGLSFFALHLLLVARSASAPDGRRNPHGAPGDDEYQLLRAIGKGFFLWAALNAGAGALDLLGKMAGAGDVMLPLRTAGYALLTDVENAGFWRVAGLHPEASAFGASALAGLAFSFTYWRASGSLPALALTVTLLALVLLSTSSTAYAGLAVLVLAAGLVTLRSLFRGRVLHTDAICVGVALVAITAVLAVKLVDNDAFAQVEALLRTTILDKSTSASGVERAYWNQRSLDSFFTTFMLGIGMGSSRSSSWIISILSQLGLVGAVLVACLTLLIAWPSRRRLWGEPARGSAAHGVIVLHDSVRAAVLTLLLAATIGGGNADPGVLFFIGLATILGCRRYLERRVPMPSAADAGVGGPLALAQGSAA